MNDIIKSEVARKAIHLSNAIIPLSYYFFSPDKIDMIIVHEICHTFHNCSTHGKLWNNKMIKVSDRCDKLNNYRLADQIRHELENYELV